jgi:hypothetical protein
MTAQRWWLGTGMLGYWEIYPVAGAGVSNRRFAGLPACLQR